MSFTRSELREFQPIMPTDLDPKPGEKALATVQKDVAVFKVPKSIIRKVRQPKKILDEEAYIEEMGKIIQRDFFPDLEKVKAQNEYLDAVEKNDIQKLREIYEKYSSGRRPPTERYAASPATFETPVDVRREEGEEVAGTAPFTENTNPGTSGKSECNDAPNVSKLSLDQYLNAHTSEDNQSFQEIMKNADVKYRQKFSWLYDAEAKCNERKEEMLALPSIQDQAEPYERPLNLDTWTYKNKNYIMFVPDGVQRTAEEEVEMAKLRQEVVHGNTRLAGNPFDEKQNKEVIQELAHSQARAQEGKIGVDGKVVTASDEPTVNGYGFMATPSPAPGVNESPLMTWGEIEGTPFRLDGGDTPRLLHATPGPSFKIPEPPKREKLALKLAEKAGQHHRDRKQKAIEAAWAQLRTPSPRRPGSGSLERLNSMSPAARRLASSQLGRLGTDHALRASYSPSPRQRSGTPGTPSILPSPSSKTPRQRTNTPGGGKRSLASVKGKDVTHLTDNLLNLPKRPRASDFFES
ncbi:splicing factor ESS-2 homolog isoform X2 [Ischnura elegans]|uniref:splicing factor ESS-2 homolog isoform X2 n=1 Tax=Ischnura elegans TaxID=197161 RepID=UPI001ED876F9|nr:splicing factor ESS-2 homolog isoform X2 [Ischnura elegans]